MSGRSLPLLVAAIAATSACAGDGAAITPARSAPVTVQTKRSNKEAVRNVYELALNTGDLHLLDRWVAPDFVGPRGDVGPSAFGRTVSELRSAFPDLRYTVEDLVEEGDRVAIRWTWTGTHQGRFRGFPPSGKRISNSGFAVFQVRDGKLVRAWLETDRLGFLQHIGALPPELAARLQPAQQRAE